MSAPTATSSERTWRRWALRFVLVIGGAAAASGIALAIRSSMRATDSASGARDAFFAAARAGDVEAAYAQLTSARRASLSREAFQKVVAHPALRGGREGSFRPPRQKSPGLCSLGTIPAADGEWAVETYFLEDADGAWRLHSVAVQPPAGVQLGTLLEECGYWEGTTTGYSGPPVERLVADR